MHDVKDHAWLFIFKSFSMACAWFFDDERTVGERCAA
jgi:hypothetical protein